MVSVSSQVPLLDDGKVDVQRWCARLGASHEKLDEAELMGVVGWLAGLDSDRLAQSLELAEMVAELRLIVLPCWRRLLIQPFDGPHQ